MNAGGTPVLLYGLGYGFEGQNDVGETYDFILGDRLALPIAATLGLVDMREGGALSRHRKALLYVVWLAHAPTRP